MPTLIDSLVVALGMDASGFTKGAKDTSTALKKTSDEATRTAKEMEARGKQAAQFFGQIKSQVIGLFAVFTAGKGLSSFVSDVVAGDAAVGRLAKNVGMSTDSLSAWQGVAERAGGSAGGMSGSIQHISSEMQKLALTGSTDMIPFLTLAHVNLQKFLSTSTPMSEKLLELSDAFQKMSPQKAQAIGAGLGLDQGTINVLMQGRTAVQALLAEQMKIGATNDADAASAQRLQSAWRALSQGSTDLGRKILTSLSPGIQALSSALLKLSEWAATHRPMVEAMFVGLAVAVTAFAVVLAAPLAGIAALSAGIGVAVAAIAVLYDDWKTWIDGGQSAFGGFYQFFVDAWNGIVSAASSAIDFLKSAFSVWATIARDELNLVKSLFTGSADDIRAAWGRLFGDIGADLSAAANVFVKVWRASVELVKSGFTSFVGDVKSDFIGFVQFIKELGPMLLAAFKASFASAFGWVEGRIRTFRNLITGKHDGTTPEPTAPSKPAGTPTASAPAAPSKPSGGKSVLAEAMQAAKASEAKYGIPASVTLAQFALESGNGAHMPAGSNNPFGIKAKAGQPYVESQTNEFINGKMERVSQKFAKFDSLGDAFDAHAKLLATASPYAAARTHANDPKAFANALTGVYATDPQYGAKLNSIMARNNASGGGNTSTSDVKIAQITVNTKATDAAGIAKEIGPAVQKYAFTAQANTGLS